MSETKDTQGTEIKTKRDLPIGIGPKGTGQVKVTRKLSADEKQITKEIIRSALRDKINDDDAFTDTEIVLTRRFGLGLVSEVIHEEEALFRFKNMEETKPTQDTEAKLAKQQLLTIHGLGGIGKTSLAKQYAEREEAEKEQIRNELDNSPKDLNSLAATIMDLMKHFDSRLISEVIHEEEKDAISKYLKDAKLRAEAYQQARFDAAVSSLAKAEQTLMPQHNNTIIIPFRIIEEPLTPQNLALILNALTELTTKFWLIAKHRFADLIEYTQTHDIRFANEAGTTIAWITQNTPLNFGLNVDKVVPGVAEAVMTVVNGLTQRKAHLEQLELDNLAAELKIIEAEENLKQQQEMAAIEREKQEIALEKLRLENEKERQALVEQRLESQIKQIEYALELAGKAVDIIYPNADAEMRPMLIQTVLNNILQLQSATGIELILILPENKDEDKPKEDAGQ